MVRKFAVYIRKYLFLLKAIFHKGRLLSLLSSVGSFLFKQYSSAGLPFVIQIEPTNQCRLHCALCLTGNGRLKRDKGIMAFSCFKKILGQFAGKTGYLGLYNLGEPLLNKEIFQMIRYAKTLNIYVRLNTSGVFEEEEAKYLVATGVDELVVSLDCATPETYLKYKSADNFQSVLRNVNLLVQARGKELRPFISLQLLLMRETEKETAAFKLLARQLKVDKALIKKIRVNFPGVAADDSFLPEQEPLRRNSYRSKYKRGKCYRPWVSTVVLWDGEVVPCCFDMEGEYGFGNLLTEDFREIWNNKSYRLFREKALNPIAVQDFICNECSISEMRQDLEVFM